MSLRGAGATWQSQGGVANGPRDSSGQHDAGAVRKPPFSCLRGAGGNTGMGDCYENRPFSFFVVPLITGMGDCYENSALAFPPVGGRSLTWPGAPHPN